jgi:hypothetical protein
MNKSQNQNAKHGGGESIDPTTHTGARYTTETQS